MATTLFRNIKLLVNTRTESHLLRGSELSQLPCIEHAYLLVEDEHIAAYGHMKEWKGSADIEIDAAGKLILPAWCDSHSHLVFAGSRETEFIDKIKGLSYEEIATVLSCSKGTVASRLNRGHKALARKLSHLRDEVVVGD